MKYKQVNFRLTNEEYELFQKVKLEMVLREKKEFTMTSAIIRLVKEYLNGNKQPPKETPQETQDTTSNKGSFADILDMEL